MKNHLPNIYTLTPAACMIRNTDEVATLPAGLRLEIDNVLPVNKKLRNGLTYDEEFFNTLEIPDLIAVLKNHPRPETGDPIDNFVGMGKITKMGAGIEHMTANVVDTVTIEKLKQMNSAGLLRELGSIAFKPTQNSQVLCAQCGSPAKILNDAFLPTCEHDLRDVGIKARNFMVDHFALERGAANPDISLSLLNSIDAWLVNSEKALSEQANAETPKDPKPAAKASTDNKVSEEDKIVAQILEDLNKPETVQAPEVNPEDLKKKYEGEIAKLKEESEAKIKTAEEQLGKVKDHQIAQYNKLYKELTGREELVAELKNLTPDALQQKLHDLALMKSKISSPATAIPAGSHIPPPPPQEGTDEYWKAESRRIFGKYDLPPPKQNP